jgi:hypothetical protein
MTMKSTVLWDVTPCSLVEITASIFSVPSNRETKKATSFSLLGALFDTENGGSIFLRNDGRFLPDCMASHE